MIARSQAVARDRRQTRRPPAPDSLDGLRALVAQPELFAAPVSDPIGLANLVRERDSDLDCMIS